MGQNIGTDKKCKRPQVLVKGGTIRACGSQMIKVYMNKIFKF